MQNVSRLSRSTMLLSVYIQHPHSVPDILTPKSILDDICFPSKELFRLLNPMFVQIMTKILAQYLLNPLSFARAIHSFFSDEPTDLVFFAYTTFPSLFSFFYIPDLVENAIQFVFELMNIDPGDIAAHFAAALFVSFPRFADNLWSTFFRKLRREDQDEWGKFLEALGISCKFLSSFHCDLARRVWKLGRTVFVHIFVDFLLISSLKLHLECDVSSHFLNGKCELMEDFRQIRIEPESDRLTQICEIMASEAVVDPEYSIYGGYAGLNLKLYPTFLSAYEMRIIFGVITGSETKHGDAEKAMKMCKPAMFATFRSGELEIFNTFSIVEPVTCYDMIQRSKRELPVLENNQEYVRCFGQISDYAKRKKVDLLSIIEPCLFPGCAKSAEKLNRVVSILKDPAFKMFAVVEMLKHTNHCFAKFEEDLTMRQYDRQYRIVGAHAQHQYNIFLNFFVRRFGTFGNKPLEFRAKLFETKTIGMVTSHGLHPCNDPPITHPIILREIEFIRIEICVFLRMETSERVVAIPQLIEESLLMEKLTGQQGILRTVISKVIESEEGQLLLEALEHFSSLDLPEEQEFAVWLQQMWHHVNGLFLER
jgi:hypothetical protein